MHVYVIMMRTVGNEMMTTTLVKKVLAYTQVYSSSVVPSKRYLVHNIQQKSENDRAAIWIQVDHS